MGWSPSTIPTSRGCAGCGGAEGCDGPGPPAMGGVPNAEAGPTLKGVTGGTELSRSGGNRGRLTGTLGNCATSTPFRLGAGGAANALNGSRVLLGGGALTAASPLGADAGVAATCAVA